MPDKTYMLSSRKWQVTINNPAEHGFTYDTVKATMAKVRGESLYWCICTERGDECETEHYHIFIYRATPFTAKQINSLFPNCHREICHGSAADNVSYIRKDGEKFNKQPDGHYHYVDKTGQEHDGINYPDSFYEFGVCPEEHQGNRSDLQRIEELINDGLNPREIFDYNFSYRRYERLIKGAFYDRKKRNTPIVRDVKVHYLVGESGTGKSYTYVQLCEEHGEDNVYFLSDYSIGGFDAYAGEPILMMDEFKAQMTYAQLLQILDKYKAQIHARYSNVVALWTEVYITSVFPPEELYKKHG